MSEITSILKSEFPITIESLKRDLINIGVKSGDILLVHSSLSSLGWVCGGAQSVITALTEVLGPHGTLVMPSHSGDWSNPVNWENPPVPQAWIPIIRDSMPAYNPYLTKTRGMGTIAELFRLQPGVNRSNHPQLSFSSRGPFSEAIISTSELFPQLGMNSPLGKLYNLNAKVLLLGVGYDSNTCFHLAETLLPSMKKRINGTAMIVDGKRSWVEFDDYDYNSDDFSICGEVFDQSNQSIIGNIGYGESRLFSIKNAVDHALAWLKINRQVQE